MMTSVNAQNLVKNPGFEEADTCSFGLGFSGNLHYWFIANNTPDHLQSCLPYGSANGLPLNLFTFQHPYEGNSCVGIFTYHQNGQNQQREWIQSELIEPLVLGETYYCSFRANAGFGGNAQYPQIWVANDKVGMLFTMDSVSWEVFHPDPQWPDHAHVYYPEILSDTIGWTLVSGSFVADSAYRYIMIGQFFSNALTDTLQFAPPGDDPWAWFPRAYTLIDDVCVSSNPAGCDLAQGVVETAMAEVSIHPNPALDRLSITNGAGSHVTVYDMLGHVIWHGRIQKEPWALDVQAWERTAYVLRMEKQGHVRSFKFVLIE